MRGDANGEKGQTRVRDLYLRENIFVVIRELGGRLEKGAGNLHCSAFLIGVSGHPRESIWRPASDVLCLSDRQRHRLVRSEHCPGVRTPLPHPAAPLTPRSHWPGSPVARATAYAFCTDAAEGGHAPRTRACRGRRVPLPVRSIRARGRAELAPPPPRMGPAAPADRWTQRRPPVLPRLENGSPRLVAPGFPGVHHAGSIAWVGYALQPAAAAPFPRRLSASFSSPPSFLLGRPTTLFI